MKAREGDDSILYDRKQRHLHVCTFTTHSVGYFPALLKSASELSINLKVLGWGATWEGFGQKLAYICDFIDSLPDDDAVMAIDGFDIIMLQPPRVILERFAHHGGFEGTFLACAEGAEHIWMTIHNLLFRQNDNMGVAWPEVPPYVPPGLVLKLLNAGCWMSTVKTAKKVFSGIPKELNDQKYLTSLYIKQLMNVKVDSGCTIFHLWRGEKHVEMMDVNTVRSRYPYKRPFYWADEQVPAQHLGGCGVRAVGEFRETPLSRTAHNKVLVDVKAGTVPCVLHIHCLRNVDYLARQMDLPPTIATAHSAAWYYWYSFKAHLTSPVTWWWAVICLTSLLFLGSVGILTGGMGYIRSKENSKVFLTILVVSALVVGLVSTLLVGSILYIDRPRIQTEGTVGSRLLQPGPQNPLWGCAITLCLILWIVSVIASVGALWNPYDTGGSARTVFSFSFSSALTGSLVLLTWQIFNRCQKHPSITTERSDGFTPFNSEDDTAPE